MSEFSDHEPKKGVFAISSKTDVLEDIRTFLRDDAEFELIGFSQTGREGIQKAVELKPVIILLDISIFDMNTIEVAEQLCASLSSAKVIMLTTNNPGYLLKRALEVGVSNFLTKPLLKNELVGVVRYIIQSDEE